MCDRRSFFALLAMERFVRQRASNARPYGVVGLCVCRETMGRLPRMLGQGVSEMILMHKKRAPQP